jgi:hypothetical protein
MVLSTKNAVFKMSFLKFDTKCAFIIILEEMLWSQGTISNVFL